MVVITMMVTLMVMVRVILMVAVMKKIFPRTFSRFRVFGVVELERNAHDEDGHHQHRSLT